MKTVFINDIRVDFNDISTPVKTQKYTYVLEPKAHHTISLTDRILLVSPSEETIESLVTQLLEEPVKMLTSGADPGQLLLNL